MAGELLGDEHGDEHEPDDDDSGDSIDDAWANHVVGNSCASQEQARVDMFQNVGDISTGSSEPVSRTKVQRPQRQCPKRAESKRPETKTSLDPHIISTRCAPASCKRLPLT
jgi:hypothetical protein